MIENKKVMFSVVIIVFVLVVGSVYVQQSQLKDIIEIKDTKVQELTDLRYAVDVKSAEVDAEIEKVVLESTGISTSLVGVDKVKASEFFKPAFNWKDSKTYNEIRGAYLESLGDNNSFTKTYMPKDIEIDVTDGKLSYIEHTGLKTEFESIEVIPLVAENNRVRYIAFVNYFSIKSDKDLVNKSALDSSEAIIKFTVSGELDDRVISEVEAWSGFTVDVENIK